MVNVKLEKTNIPKTDSPFFDLFVLFILTGDTITNAAEMELGQYQVNFPQARVLFILHKEKRPMTYQELSHRVLRELNSVSTLINRMESSGLVKKDKRKGDKKTYVTLTEKGADLLRNQITTKAQQMIFSVLSEDERQAFEASLKKLLGKARTVLGVDFKPPFLS